MVSWSIVSTFFWRARPFLLVSSGKKKEERWMVSMDALHARNWTEKISLQYIYGQYCGHHSNDARKNITSYCKWSSMLHTTEISFSEAHLLGFHYKFLEWAWAGPGLKVGMMKTIVGSARSLSHGSRTHSMVLITSSYAAGCLYSGPAGILLTCRLPESLLPFRCRQCINTCNHEANTMDVNEDQ